MNRFECLEAARLAVTAREQHYGGPEQNFTTAAQLWTIILGRKVEAHEVALCLDALKTARLINDPSHADSWVDKAGYSSCGAEVTSGTR